MMIREVRNGVYNSGIEVSKGRRKDRGGGKIPAITLLLLYNLVKSLKAHQLFKDKSLFEIYFVTGTGHI